jgi:hypothetical protein
MQAISTRGGRRLLINSAMSIMMLSVIFAMMHFDPGNARGIGEAGGAPESLKGPFTIDFSGYTGGSVEKWLVTRSFNFEKDAKNRTLLGLSITNHTLELTANGRMSGFIFNDSINLDNVGRVRIAWGITRYPQEASYEKKVNNEALMLYIFFGKEKVSSGSILIPNSPYFIGLFLCQDEQVNFPYKGRYFHAGGRFVCLGKPDPGETVVSEFDLDRAFRNYFGKQQTPGISGIAFGIDTSKAGGGGKGGGLYQDYRVLRSVETDNSCLPLIVSGLAQSPVPAVLVQGDNRQRLGWPRTDSRMSHASISYWNLPTPSMHHRVSKRVRWAARRSSETLLAIFFSHPGVVQCSRQESNKRSRGFAGSLEAINELRRARNFFTQGGYREEVL